MKTYILMTVVDGDIMTETLSKDEIIEKTEGLEYCDFVVIDGKIIKDETKKFQKHLLE